MKKLSLIAGIFLLPVASNAQSNLKLDYFSTIPTAIKKCGALYTYDSIGFKKNKFILLTDFQNIGIIKVGGKQVSLTLSETKLVEKTNVTTYKGSGYTVVLSVATIQQTEKLDIEAGTLSVSKGTKSLLLKIHGQSQCDESSQEGNQ